MILRIYGHSATREQVGVTTDLGVDPTLVRIASFTEALFAHSPYSRTRISLVPNVTTKSESVAPAQWSAAYTL